MNHELGWIHRFERGSAPYTVLLLHGTGGDENSLFDLGRKVAPGASLLGVRGRSLEEGSPRFFRRYSATRYDQEHLLTEAAALVSFTSAAKAQYEIASDPLIALGYSNGANIAVAALVHAPGTFSGMALLRPVMPLEEPPIVNLHNVPVLIAAGRDDSYLPYGSTLAPYLRHCKGDVVEVLQASGHELSIADVEVLASWFAKTVRVAV